MLPSPQGPSSRSWSGLARALTGLDACARARAPTPLPSACWPRPPDLPTPGRALPPARPRARAPAQAHHATPASLERPALALPRSPPGGGCGGPALAGAPAPPAEHPLPLSHPGRCAPARIPSREKFSPSPHGRKRSNQSAFTLARGAALGPPPGPVCWWTSLEQAPGAHARRPHPRSSPSSRRQAPPPGTGPCTRGSRGPRLRAHVQSRTCALVGEWRATPGNPASLDREGQAPPLANRGRMRGACAMEDGVGDGRGVSQRAMVVVGEAQAYPFTLERIMTCCTVPKHVNTRPQTRLRQQLTW